MKKSKYSNRVALNFMLASAILSSGIFLTVYFVVHSTVYNHLEGDLDAESLELFNSVVVLSDKIYFANPNEWLENEHGQIEVNPIFIQYADSSGSVIKKSPNLVNGSLRVYKDKSAKFNFKDVISGSQIYQLQVPVKNLQSKILGFISVAMPLEDTLMVLKNLRIILIIAFPLVLLILYFISDYIARKSIEPIFRLTNTAQEITHENLKERIELPGRKDELYTLTETINGLLDRLQNAVQREKQFTSDASHELRTPLSILKSTLELMLRKPREVEYYENKLKYGLSEIDRMSELVEQLLLLARYESGKETLVYSEVQAVNLIPEVLSRLEPQLTKKDISFDIKLSESLKIRGDKFMLSQIFDNIITNAIKYSDPGGMIRIFSETSGEHDSIVIEDEGAGMPQEELTKIFERFYRTDQSRNSNVGGNGLGLSIVKRFSDILGITVKVNSKPGSGTSFRLIFTNNLSDS
ncbi:sensor histidine kinase [Saccharicrinis sp. FJH54]|uniref:sensor histidine kinase n=1 Tax=Saccharicrinis sp. FJH54 TaxID=3344665 RepID=UPI0035D49BFF